MRRRNQGAGLTAADAGVSTHQIISQTQGGCKVVLLWYEVRVFNSYLEKVFLHRQNIGLVEKVDSIVLLGFLLEANQ